MARTPAQRGPIGTWLVEQRQQRGWRTAALARAEIERLGGLRIAPSVYAEWESGRRLPSEANLARLEAFYGTKANAKEPDPSMDVARLVETMTAAMEAQTRALTQLADLIVGARATALAEREALTDMLAHLGDELEALRASVGIADAGARQGPGRN